MKMLRREMEGDNIKGLDPKYKPNTEIGLFSSPFCNGFKVRDFGALLNFSIFVFKQL